MGYHIKGTKENSAGAVKRRELLHAILAGNCMPHNVHGLNWFLIRFLITIGNFFHVSASVSQVSHVLDRIKVLDIFEVGVFEFENILPLDVSELSNGIRCLVCLRKNITWHSSSNFFTRPSFTSATIEKLTFPLFAKNHFLNPLVKIVIYYQRFVAGLSGLKILVAESNAPPKPYISTVATDSEVSIPELQACLMDRYEPGAVEVAEVE